MFSWRILVTLFWVASFLACLPVWWQRTEVERAPFPEQEIEKLSQSAEVPMEIMLQVKLIDGSSGEKGGTIFLEHLNKLLQQKLKKMNDNEDNLRFHSKFGILPTHVPEHTEGVDEWLKSKVEEEAKSGAGENIFSVFVIPKKGEHAESEIHLGKYSHGWVDIPYSKSLDEAKAAEVASLISAMMHNIFVTPDTTRTSEEKSMIQVELEPTYRISFSLANGNPDAISGWQFSEAAVGQLNNILSLLSGVSPLSVTSQVVHYTALGGPRNLQPKKKKISGDSTQKNYYFYLSKEDLPYVVDSNSWNLDFVADASQTQLNFVLYVPPASFSPLYIVPTTGENITDTNGWIIPQWGGVVIYNPKEAEVGKLRVSSLSAPFSTFVSQLRDFFGLPSAGRRRRTISDYLKNDEKSTTSTKIEILASPLGATQWEISALKLKRLRIAQRASLKTLLQFRTLFHKLPGIPLSTNTAQLITDAIENLTLATSSPASLLSFSRTMSAHAKAETAFFDPDMLARLYFPAEHKWAVYLPLFLPLWFPLFGNLSAEYKRYKRKRRRQQRSADSARNSPTPATRPTPNARVVLDEPFLPHRADMENAQSTYLNL